MSQLTVNFSKALSVMANSYNCTIDRDSKGCSFVISKPDADTDTVARQMNEALKSLSNTGENIEITFQKQPFYLRRVSKQISAQGNPYVRFWMVRGIKVEDGLGSKLLSMLSGTEEPAAEQVKDTVSKDDTVVGW